MNKLETGSPLSGYEKGALEKLTKKHLFVAVIDYEVIEEMSLETTGKKFNKSQIEMCATMLNSTVDYEGLYYRFLDIIRQVNQESNSWK